jgi:hypothetical protein
MFQLDKQTVKLSNFNARSELNGETRKPAADISCSAQLPNSILDSFDAALRQFLYMPPANPDLAEQANPDAATALRLPLLGLPLDWSLVLENRKLTIDYGLGDEKSNIVLVECKVHKFKITPQNGGSVLVAWQISAHPDAATAGWLYDHQQQEIVISIEDAAPQDDAQAAIPGTKSKKQKNAEAKEKLNELFVKGEPGDAGTPVDMTEPGAAASTDDETDGISINIE